LGPLPEVDLPHLLSRTIEDIYRDESRRICAILIRLIGDFDLAEQEGFKDRGYKR
jgi:predicted RNA polymerase sigma factor